MSIEAVQSKFVYVGKFLLSLHTKQRMEERLISLDEISDVLLTPHLRVKSRKYPDLWEYRRGVITASVDEVDWEVTTVFYDLPEAEEQRLIESKRLLWEQAQAPKPEALTQRLELPLALLKPQQPVKAAKPAQSPTGAPMSFSDVSVQDYAIYWAKKYRELGLTP